MQELYSNVETPIFKVITDEKALKKVFLQINRTRKPGISIPKVDFTKEALLFYAAGITDGVRSFELFVWEESYDSIKIDVKNSPTSAKIAFLTNTTPFCMYSILRTNKEIVWVGDND
ncbi:hypothetical protein DHD08_06400 [Arenibacter sp. H213]|nr:hypothetical protein [Arenibacter sp. H213]